MHRKVPLSSWYYLCLNWSVMFDLVVLLQLFGVTALQQIFKTDCYTSVIVNISNSIVILQ